MSNERLDYLLEGLDLGIRTGQDPVTAWHNALNDYAYVFFTDDGKSILQRAALRALEQLEKDGKDDSGKE